MTISLPQGLPAASGWMFIDWLSVQQEAAAVAGVATIELPQLESDEQWLVDRLVISCTSTTATTLRLYNSAVSTGRLLDQTAAGNLNSSDYPTGLLLRPSTSLIAQWTGVSAGARAIIAVQARVFRRG